MKIPLYSILFMWTRYFLSFFFNSFIHTDRFMIASFTDYFIYHVWTKKIYIIRINYNVCHLSHLLWMSSIECKRTTHINDMLYYTNTHKHTFWAHITQCPKKWNENNSNNNDDKIPLYAYISLVFFDARENETCIHTNNKYRFCMYENPNTR